MSSGSSFNKSNLLLLASLLLLELSLAIMLAALYMKGDRLFDVFLSTRPGGVFLYAMAASVVSSGMIIRQYLANQRSRSREFSLVVAMNFVIVVLAVMIGEIAVRAGSRIYFDGEAVGNVKLKPKDWEAARRRYVQIVEKASGDLSYQVYDDLLGWTVGPDRHSANGLYWSNAEGMRIPQVAETLGTAGGKREIALVGDSFTFGEEVRYEESWGYRLGQMLGQEFAVSNFGVPGYGLDQMFLRWEKDVIKRKPRMVILGFISNDVIRTMLVYPFMHFPEWNMPFSKPRFILRDGVLANLNMPTIPPQAIFSRSSNSELPLLDYQAEYRASDWERRPYHLSYLLRLLTSRFPAWSVDNRPDVSEAAYLAVNAAILKVFVRSAEQAGISPLVAYFPTEDDFRNSLPLLSFGKRVLKESGIRYIDTTSCVGELNSADRFLAAHYSPAGNTAVAECLYKAVTEELAKAQPGQ